jgi:Methylase involved in ubiquinone/menaquinone biosynthesis
MPLDYFSLIAGLYNKLAKFNTSAAFLDFLSLSRDYIVLDAGGGTGRVTEAIRGQVRGAVVADISQGMLRYAVSKGLSTACTPLEDLPFSSNTFDRVIMMDALHHVFDQDKAINELWRVLVPGGYLIIIEPDIHKYSVKLIAIAEKILLMHSHILDDNKITSLFANHFIKIKVIHDESNVWIRAEKVREL